MLKSLYISNYALISELDIRFDKGMTVLTGETGAGKSIIIGALSLILGQRADTKAIKTEAEKCIIEAIFDVSEYNHLDTFFTENDLDNDKKNCIIRREITNSGKSRAFINDSPVGLNIIRDLTSQLIDIHSQHENLLISNENYQLDIVDAVASNQLILKAYQSVFENWNAKKSELRRTREEAQRQTREADYIQFQFKQLTEARLIENEQELLETELEILNHSEEIKSELERSKVLLTEDQAVIPLLKDAVNSIQKVKSYLTDGESWFERMQSAYIEIKDIAAELSLVAENVEFNPEKLAETESRLSEIYTLQKKYKADSVAQLIHLRDSFEEQLNKIESYDEEIQKLTKEIELLESELENAAMELRKSRRDVCRQIESYLENQLVKLGIPNVQIQIAMAETPDFQLTGKDQVQFMFSANKNRALQAVQLIASGGEISRLMLSIKSLVISKQNLPTIIFDEIDTGVSGEIAHRMGEIMQEMSAGMQVICITHLPQIAAKGNQHFRVYKDDQSEQTETHINLLNGDKRIDEIAEMLSGKNPSEAARQNARELLRIS